MKKRWPTVLVIMLSLLAALFVMPVINDISLHSFAKQLNEHPLPPITKILEKKEACGKLNGNGNGMDFFACILIQSDLSKADLKQYYKDSSFNTAKPVRKNVDQHTVNVNIVQPTGSILQTDYVEHQVITFNSLKEVTDFSKYYVVMLYDGGYSADFDLRGH